MSNVVAVRKQVYDPVRNQWCSAIILGRVRHTKAGLVHIRTSDGHDTTRSFRDLVLIRKLTLANRPTFCIRLPDIQEATQLLSIQHCPGKGLGIRANRTHVTFPIALGIHAISLAEANEIVRANVRGAITAVMTKSPAPGTRRSQRARHVWPGMYNGAKPGLIVESASSAGSPGRRLRNFCIRNHWVYYCNAPSDNEVATHRFRERRSRGDWELYIEPLQPVLSKNQELMIQYNCDWRKLE